MSVRDAIDAAVHGEEVPSAILEAAFGEIMDGKATPVGIAALLVALRAKGETVEEIVAAARALRERAVPGPPVAPETLDTCGTGGDGLQTFNISTTAAFVVAGAGVPVAKHGNRAASSRAGSIDVLEALGVKIEIPVEASAEILGRVGIAPFFARQAHPAMRFVAPVRAELGIRTLMNCLGPLLNPVGVRRQLVGVYSPSLVEPLATALGALGSERALVVHGSDGLDEITTSGPTLAAWVEDSRVLSMTIDPASLSIPPPVAGALRGGDPEANALITRSVLDGEPGARRDVVILNAAAALWVADAATDLRSAMPIARESIDSGAARAKLEELIRVSAEYAPPEPGAA